MGEPSGKRVCVIGAGVAGLVCAKVLRDDGFDVAIFEKESALGGVWVASRTYPGLRSNNPQKTYSFSDHSYPNGADIFPTAEQIRDYLESYAKKFRLLPLLRLDTEVIEVTRTDSGFDVSTRGKVLSETQPFDFVAVCNGVFSKPFIPEIEGRSRYKGGVLHSSQAVNPEIFQGKRITVVGAGKSAFDCASFAAEHARSCTLVYRAAHWMVPRYYFELFRIDWMGQTRFSEAFHRYYRLSRAESILHGIGQPFLHAWWRFMRWLMLRWLVDLPPEFVPDTRLPRGLENLGTGSDFYDLYRGGKITAKRGRIRGFNEAGIVLDNGDIVEADIVIFATGWNQAISFLSSELRSVVQTGDRFRLYRHILPPEEKRLGFVGYASSIICPLTSEVGAHWLSQNFRGELALPTAKAMKEEILQIERWAEEVMPARAQGYFIGAYAAHYIDDLLRDMGLRTKRTSNFLTEYFAPLWAERYATLSEERRARRNGTPTRHWYLSAELAAAALVVIAALWILFRG